MLMRRAIDTRALSAVGVGMGLMAPCGPAHGQVTCPVFSAGPAARTIVPGQTGTLTLSVQSGVRFAMNEGNLDIDLMLTSAPVTCANFLNYVRSGRYDGVMFHRSLRYTTFNQIGIIQGGGFRGPTLPLNQFPSAPIPPGQAPTPIATDPPIAIEHAVGNVRGTIAMARTADPVSATSQFFFNTVDNNVDVQNERFSLDALPGVPGRDGYAVFGVLTPASLPVMDVIRDYTYYQLSQVLQDSVFATTPLRVPPAQAGFPLLPVHYVTINSATVRESPAASFTGGGWVYRWRRNGVDLSDGGRISGAATAELSIAAMTAADFGVYECRVSGLVCGAGSAASGTVTFSCPADVGVVGGGTGADGVLDNNDFISSIGLFFNGDARADVGSAGGENGHDGAFDNNDFVAFINRFFDGC